MWTAPVWLTDRHWRCAAGSVLAALFVGTAGGPPLCPGDSFRRDLILCPATHAGRQPTGGSSQLASSPSEMVGRAVHRLYRGDAGHALSHAAAAAGLWRDLCAGPRTRQATHPVGPAGHGHRCRRRFRVRAARDHAALRDRRTQVYPSRHLAAGCSALVSARRVGYASRAVPMGGRWPAVHRPGRAVHPITRFGEAAHGLPATLLCPAGGRDIPRLVRAPCVHEHPPRHVCQSLLLSAPRGRGCPNTAHAVEEVAARPDHGIGQPGRGRAAGRHGALDTHLLCRAIVRKGGSPWVGGVPDRARAPRRRRHRLPGRGL